MNLFKAMAAELLALPYRARMGRVGRRPRIRPPLLISGGQRIELGDDVYVEPYVALSAGPGGRVRIGSNCELRSFARLEADTGIIEIGDRSSVNPFCNLNGFGGITIGSNVRVASHTVILSSSHRFDDPTQTIREQGVIARPTVIEDDVWFGAHCVVVGGVRGGEHSTIGSGAAVLHHVPSNSVAAGVPARVIRTRAR